jgi:hypothetical protein
MRRADERVAPTRQDAEGAAMTKVLIALAVFALPGVIVGCTGPQAQPTETRITRSGNDTYIKTDGRVTHCRSTSQFYDLPQITTCREVPKQQQQPLVGVVPGYGRR